MAARTIDGRALGARIKREAAAIVADLAASGGRVTLDAVLVGDPAVGELYARSQRVQCQEVGIEYRLHTLPDSVTQQDLESFLRALNDDPSVTGILLNLPLPQRIDAPAAQYAIHPYKDIEGVNPANLGLLFYDEPIIAPCTALAVMEILKEAGVNPQGLSAVVVGQGAIVGKPVSLFLLHKLATVTSCHAATRDLAQFTRQADVLVVAVGRPGLIGAQHIKPGAVVIDVGINSVTTATGERKIVGDCLQESVALVASVITPVPGGVGPVTVAILLRSAAQAAVAQRFSPRRISP